jgi:hypothetical protein
VALVSQCAGTATERSTEQPHQPVACQRFDEAGSAHEGEEEPVTCSLVERAARADRIRVRLVNVPAWLPPLATAAFTVLLLNIALLVQRARGRAEDWPERFLRDLRRWDGRLPDELDRRARP